jgi:hypothetical protein
MRLRLAIIAVTLATVSAGTTLERLSLEDMAQKSTGIVRGRVSGCAGEMRQNVIFTRCDVSVSETWKGNAAPRVSVYVPGGRVGRLTQTIAGAPALENGQEYVIFLWAGRSGINQVIGLHQGVFQLAADAEGTTIAQRAATAERMLDAGGLEVSDQSLRYTAAELKSRVLGILRSRD